MLLFLFSGKYRKEICRKERFFFLSHIKKSTKRKHSYTVVLFGTMLLSNLQLCCHTIYGKREYLCPQIVDFIRRLL